MRRERTCRWRRERNRLNSRLVPLQVMVLVLVLVGLLMRLLPLPLLPPLLLSLLPLLPLLLLSLWLQGILGFVVLASLVVLVAIAVLNCMKQPHHHGRTLPCVRGAVRVGPLCCALGPMASTCRLANRVNSTRHRVGEEQRKRVKHERVAKAIPRADADVRLDCCTTWCGPSTPPNVHSASVT